MLLIARWICGQSCTPCYSLTAKQAVREAAQYTPPLYAARCSPAPAHPRLTPAAPSAPCAIEYSWSTGSGSLGGSVEYGVFPINYVVTWTANQSGLVTLTFDLLTLKVVSVSRVTWATSVPILVFLGICSPLRPVYATDRRQTNIIA